MDNGELHYPTGWDNPRTMDIEEYLPDVPEVPDDWPAETLQAQAIAARSFAWARSVEGTKVINNSVSYQVYIPNSRKERPKWVANVQATAGIYLRHPTTTLVEAEFSRDHGGDWTTGSPSKPYKKSVYDPGGFGGGHGRGLSQLGACRWITGDNPPPSDWRCTWSDGNIYPLWSSYQQILAHYYTGISIVDLNGRSLAPDHRWNAISATAPVSMTVGQTYNVSVLPQNTGVAAWDNSIGLAYWWEGPAGRYIPPITPISNSKYGILGSRICGRSFKISRILLRNIICAEYL